MIKISERKEYYLQSNENYTDSSLLWKSEIIENSSQVKKNSFQSKIKYPEKLPFKNEGEIKTFPDKHK